MRRTTLLLLLTACGSDVSLRPSAFEGDDPGECADGADNDRDGAFDCDDGDCAGASGCGGDTDTDADTTRDTAPEDTVVEDTEVDDTVVEDTEVDDTDVVVDTDTDVPTQAEFTTPGEHAFQVPTGVTALTVRAWGGGGAGGSQLGATGGGGGFVAATFPVTPGETLAVQVGEGGDSTGDGGGASIVLRGSTVLVVAGGGGGGASDGNSGNSWAGGAGGGGGGIVGQDGQDLGNGPLYAYCTGATGGKGGSATVGGDGGTYTGTAEFPCNGQPGASLAGGAAHGVNGTCATDGAADWESGGGQANGGGGGGGAGWFGGGGGGFIWTYCAAGGGGGSSYVPPNATGTATDRGARQVQGNAAASQGAGRGGDRAWNPSTGSYDAAFGLGAHGRIELGW